MTSTTLRRLRNLVIIVAIIFVVLESINLSTTRLGPFNNYHLLPFLYPNRIENFDFKDTTREAECRNGTIKDTSQIPGPVPKIVHMVMVVKQPEVDSAPGQLSILDWLCITAVLRFIQPDQIKLHYNWIDKENVWYQKVKEKITLVHYNLSDNQVAKPTWHPAHIADVIRLQALIKEGGIYMDRDIITLRSFEPLLTGLRDTIMGFEGGARGGLCNALIVSKKSSPFLVRWLAEYKNLDDSKWSYHSVILPKEMATLYPDELCELSPTVFFYPTWTVSHLQYMHTELSPPDASEFKDRIRDNKGAMYKYQMAYHVAGGERWVDAMTPGHIKQVDTPFNILVRPLLDWKE